MHDEEDAAEEERLPLDAVVSRLRDPVFARLHRRHLSLRETSTHVNPLMLAASTSGSLYVRAWRRHARDCPACAKLFDYFGLEY